jgi:hypothetical protein
MTTATNWCDYRPQTAIESEILADCTSRATMHGATVAEVLRDCVRYWQGSGRAAEPRRWKSRAAAADRLLARGELLAECGRMQLDPFVEIDNFGKLTAEQLRDELTCLGDYQG